MNQLDTMLERAVAPAAGMVDMKLEVVVIPVSDVDRAKRFYGGLGWRLDADFVVGDAFLVQFTPPGSPCSIHFGTGLTSAAPGSASGLYLVVSDIEAARAELVARGVDVSDVFHRAGPGKPPVKGPHPARSSYFSLRHVPRSGRQRVAVAGGHHPVPGSDRLERDELRLRHRISRARCGARRPPTASTRRAWVVSGMRTGRTGTPRTWWRSRPARSCRHERRLRRRRRWRRLGILVQKPEGGHR